MSFVEKIVGFGWSEHDRFEDDRDTLTRCVSRYHAFLDLMATTPGLSVPTLVRRSFSSETDDRRAEITSSLSEGY